MNGRQYETPGPFGRALERAITADARHPREAEAICGEGGCGLAAGHQERAGTDHQPILPVDPHLAPIPEGLSQNPVDGSWRYSCPDHQLLRLGLAERHAINVEAKHIREDHAEPEAELVLDLSAMASSVLASWTEPDAHCYALMGAWCALTGMSHDLALEYAKELDRRPGPVRAAVVPF